MKIKLIAWAFILIFTQGCGTKTKTTNSADLLTFDSEENLYAAIETSEVHCLESECPDYINKLAFWYYGEEEDTYYLGFCSGTLIEEEYVLTNRHCIPEELQKNGANCNRQILIQYPSSDKLEAENVDCKEVVKVYPDEEGYPDMALLKIEKSSHQRKSTEMKMNDLHANQKIHSYSMDPSTYDSKIGYIRKKECEVSMDNLQTMKMNSDGDNFIVHGSQCQVISGNSGSSMFNSKGEIVALLHSRIDEDSLEEYLDERSITYDNFLPMGVIVNISCLKGVNISDGCQQYNTNESVTSYLNQKKSEYPSLSAIEDDEIEAKINKKLEVILKKKTTLSSYFTQTLEQLKSRLSKVIDSASDSNVIKKL